MWQITLETQKSPIQTSEGEHLKARNKEVQVSQYSYYTTSLSFI